VPSNYATGDMVYYCDATYDPRFVCRKENGDMVYYCDATYDPGFVCGEGNNVAIRLPKKNCCCYSYNYYYKVCDCNKDEDVCGYFLIPISLKILVPISEASFWGCLTAAKYRSGIPFFYVYDHATVSFCCDRFTG